MYVYMDVGNLRYDDSLRKQSACFLFLILISSILLIQCIVSQTMDGWREGTKNETKDDTSAVYHADKAEKLRKRINDFNSIVI